MPYIHSHLSALTVVNKCVRPFMRPSSHPSVSRSIWLMVVFMEPFFILILFCFGIFFGNFSSPHIHAYVRYNVLTIHTSIGPFAHSFSIMFGLLFFCLYVSTYFSVGVPAGVLMSRLRWLRRNLR